MLVERSRVQVGSSATSTQRSTCDTTLCITETDSFEYRRVGAIFLAGNWAYAGLEVGMGGRINLGSGWVHGGVGLTLGVGVGGGGEGKREEVVCYNSEYIVFELFVKCA